MGSFQTASVPEIPGRGEMLLMTRPDGSDSSPRAGCWISVLTLRQSGRGLTTGRLFAQAESQLSVTKYPVR